MDISTQQLATIARTTAYHCDEQHEYMKGANGNDWLPHKWVIDAMRAAVTIRNTQAEDMIREELHQARAQLTEQTALVKWWKDHLAVHIAILFGTSGHSPEDADKSADDVIKRAERLAPTVSASAEPSVPKCTNCGASTGQACNDKGCGYLESGNGEPIEIDEQAAFMAWANEEYEVGADEELNLKNPSVRDNKIGWLARATLHRK